MPHSIIMLSDVFADDGEPRILDTLLGETLGLARDRKIRDVIAANIEELQAHGILPFIGAKSNGQRGRPAKAYYLNESQALVICALSRTDKAAEVRKALIDVFTAYRRGDLVHVREHTRRWPIARRDAEKPSDSQHERFVSFFRAFRDQPDALADWACAMTQSLDTATKAFRGY